MQFVILMAVVAMAANQAYGMQMTFCEPEECDCPMPNVSPVDFKPPTSGNTSCVCACGKVGHIYSPIAEVYIDVASARLYQSGNEHPCLESEIYCPLTRRCIGTGVGGGGPTLKLERSNSGTFNII